MLLSKKDIVIRIIADVLELDHNELELEKSFEDDYEADSLRKIEILARIEKELRVHIPQEKLNEFTDLNSVLLIVENYSGELSFE